MMFRKTINTCHLMAPLSGFVTLTCLLSIFLSNTFRSTSCESTMLCAPPVQSSLVFVSTVLWAFSAVLLLHTTQVACFASHVFNFSSEIEIRRGSFIFTSLQRSPSVEISEVWPLGSSVPLRHPCSGGKRFWHVARCLISLKQSRRVFAGRSC